MNGTTQENFPSANTNLPHVKVCGLTRVVDIQLAHQLGAEFFGLIFAKISKRRLDPVLAVDVVAEARATIHPNLRFVGVFVDEPAGEMERLYNDLGLFAVQIHGSVSDVSQVIPRHFIIPALGISGVGDEQKLEHVPVEHEAVVVDTAVRGQSGGTGQLFDHTLVKDAFTRRRVILAGGLNPANIGDVVRRLSPGPWPYAFDLSSGVEESPGIKSQEKLHAFFANYRAAFEAND